MDKKVNIYFGGTNPHDEDLECVCDRCDVKITERYITEDTWIIEATSEQEARDISLGIDPIKEEFIKSVDTYVEEVFGDA